jgi:2-polyprenyl-3-methyl-5-hydroxy-6-metoxy-1,4-benzoquinol methylase
VVFAPHLLHATDGFEAEYFAQIARLEASGHFWLKGRGLVIGWALTRYFGSAKNYLEIGCGTGHLLAEALAASPTLEVSGSEVLEEGLKYAAANVPAATLYQMDARQIPFEQEFDVIGAYDVLEHIEEDQAVLAEMFRAVTPGGGIILTVPQHPFLWGPGDDYARHKRRYTRSDLVAKVRDAGFEVIRTTSCLSLLFPALLVSRLRDRRATGTFDPLAEFRLGPLLNRMLALISATERVMIKGGLSFPFGGSLLLVARRPERQA